MSASFDYDIIIVGSGLVGASLALALAPQGKRVLLLEARKLTPLTEKQTRPISLNHSSVNIFKNLGLWPDLHAQATAIKTVHVSEAGCFGAVNMRCEDYDLDALGYVVPLHQLYNQLLSRIQALSTIDIQAETEVMQLDYRPNGIALRLPHQQTVTGELLIAADGAQSSIRSFLGIETHTQASPEKAIIATVSAQHQHKAIERFTQHGIIALLPQANQRCGLVWTSKQADALLALPDQAFLSQLQDHIGYKLGPLTDLGPRFCQPLKVTLAKEQVRPHCVLLGNAAHTFYPIAAQGFNLSLSDMAALVEVLENGQPLEHFASWRNNYQSAITQFTQSLAAVFASDHKLTATARQAGLALFAKIPALKHALARFAMGKTAKTPKLALFDSIS